MTTSEMDMLKNKKCPAGKYCAGGLSDVSKATACSVGKYCPEGKSDIFNYNYSCRCCKVTESRHNFPSLFCT